MSRDRTVDVELDTELEGVDAQRLARVRQRARSAWASSLREDDRVRRAASEQRLMGQWPRARGPAVRPVALAVLAAACVAAAGVGVRWGANANANASASASANANARAKAGAEAPVGVVVTGACSGCLVDRLGVEPGARLAVGHALSVPRGAHVTLGFALQGALVDPAVGFDVDGPAVARMTDGEGAPRLALESGTARFRGLDGMTIAVPGGRVTASGATFTVSIDARGVAHVAVEKGSVSLTSDGAATTRTIEAGADADVVADAPAAASSALAAAPPTATAPTAARASASATASARSAASPASAEKRTDPAGPDADPSTPRGAFTLAEVEMASGDPAAQERGRARLSALVTSPNIRLAADAATLLARAERTPAGRADAWARYLATQPPSPYRDRARLERAEALLDAGRRAEANALLAELRDAPLSDSQRRQLERLSFKAGSTR